MDTARPFIESPCAYAQGIIPATPGYTVLGQLSAKPHLAKHVARTIACGHRVHTPQEHPQGIKVPNSPVLTHGVFMYMDVLYAASAWTSVPLYGVCAEAAVPR